MNQGEDCGCAYVWACDLIMFEVELSECILFTCVLSALSPGEEILLLMQNGHPLNLEELKEQEQQLPQEDGESICSSKLSDVTN